MPVIATSFFLSFGPQDALHRASKSRQGLGIDIDARRGRIGEERDAIGKGPRFFSLADAGHAERGKKTLSLSLLTLTSFVPCAAARTEETIRSANRIVKYDCGEYQRGKRRGFVFFF